MNPRQSLKKAMYGSIIENKKIILFEIENREYIMPANEAFIFLKNIREKLNEQSNVRGQIVTLKDTEGSRILLNLNDEDVQALMAKAIDSDATEGENSVESYFSQSASSAGVPDGKMRAKKDLLTGDDVLGDDGQPVMQSGKEAKIQYANNIYRNLKDNGKGATADAFLNIASRFTPEDWDQVGLWAPQAAGNAIAGIKLGVPGTPLWQEMFQLAHGGQPAGGKGEILLALMLGGNVLASGGREGDADVFAPPYSYHVKQMTSGGAQGPTSSDTFFSMLNQVLTQQLELYNAQEENPQAKIKADYVKSLIALTGAGGKPAKSIKASTIEKLVEDAEAGQDSELLKKITANAFNIALRKDMDAKSFSDSVTRVAVFPSAGQVELYDVGEALNFSDLETFSMGGDSALIIKDYNASTGRYTIGLPGSSGIGQWANISARATARKQKKASRGKKRKNLKRFFPDHGRLLGQLNSNPIELPDYKDIPPFPNKPSKSTWNSYIAKLAALEEPDDTLSKADLVNLLGFEAEGDEQYELPSSTRMWKTNHEIGNLLKIMSAEEIEDKLVLQIPANATGDDVKELLKTTDGVDQEAFKTVRASSITNMANALADNYAGKTFGFPSDFYASNFGNAVKRDIVKFLGPLPELPDIGLTQAPDKPSAEAENSSYVPAGNKLFEWAVK